MVTHTAQQALQRVPHSDDVVEYTLRCVLALAPGLSAELAAAAERQVRDTFGGDRPYVGKRPGDGRSERNAQLRRDHARGERVGYLVRKYQLSRTQVYKILGDSA